ncbi:MAG: hypothetical protein E5V74_06005 [Mesorhizobium sp.]|nr:MAG: hypothetical protein E5V74_06005 [Mesorhizobium sp.]
MLLQRLGNWIVRVTSCIDVRDAPSGFSYLEKRGAAADRISSYTYTLETIIHSGRSQEHAYGLHTKSLATIADPADSGRRVQGLVEWPLNSYDRLGCCFNDSATSAVARMTALVRIVGFP